MRLKYYLRGIGIGVIVTTIILVIALDRKPEALTDAQIKARAEELGMVEGGPLKGKDESKVSDGAVEPTTGAGATVGQDVQQVPHVSATEPGTEKTTAATTKAPETTKAPVTTKAPTTTKAPATTKATEATKAAQTPQREETENGTYVTIEIGASDWSNHVASKLQAAGLVESASDFDQYLIQHGYESIIASGTHRFKVGSSYAELAKELVN